MVWRNKVESKRPNHKHSFGFTFDTGDDRYPGLQLWLM